MSPNWCSNILKISGPKDQIAVFKEIMKEYRAIDSVKDNINELSLEAFYPTPDKNDWYEWRCTHWGTKWDVTDVSVDEASDTLIIYDFQSAWSPPAAAIRHISGQFPKLQFHLSYEEPGMCFEGDYIVKNKVIIEDDERKMDSEEEEVK